MNEGRISAAYFAGAVRDALSAHADAKRAAPMAAYMKGHFAFFGIPTPERRALAKPLIDLAGKGPNADWLIEVAERLWQFPERENQYVACDLLSRHAKQLQAVHEVGLAGLVTARSWWDTVDTLANRVYGPLVANHPALAVRVRSYAAHDDVWLRRVAILHPMHYGEETDVEALAMVLDENLAHPDFFIRKASGWILRQYARTAPDWVRAYVASRADRMSPLTRREALKHLV